MGDVFVGGKNRKGKEKEKGKGEIGKKEKKRKERERERKGREKEGEKEIGVFFLSSPAFRQLELVGPRSKVRIFDEGYAPRGQDFSYFGLFLSFGLLFWADFGIVLCHVYGMGRVCSWFKGLLLGRIWVETLRVRALPKCPCTLLRGSHAIAWLLHPSCTLLHGIGAVAWPLLHFNFGLPYLSRLDSDTRVLDSMKSSLSVEYGHVPVIEVLTSLLKS